MDRKNKESRELVRIKSFKINHGFIFNIIIEELRKHISVLRKRRKKADLRKKKFKSSISHHQEIKVFSLIELMGRLIYNWFLSLGIMKISLTPFTFMNCCSWIMQGLCKTFLIMLCMWFWLFFVNGESLCKHMLKLDYWCSNEYVMNCRINMNDWCCMCWNCIPIYMKNCCLIVCIEF